MASAQEAIQKPTFVSCARKFQKICFKTFRTNTFLFNFVNLSKVNSP